MPNEKKPKTKCVEYLRHAEYYDMQSTFDELYARSQAGEIFENLMDVILSRENILLAYRNIKSNTGSITPGTDKLKISDIGKLTADEVTARVRKIVKGAKNGYTPRSVRRKDIPKPNGNTRPLGIPCIWDRLVQQCIKQVMEPICEARFSNNSYGFRPNRSVENAIAAIYRLMQKSGLHYVVEFDIKGFFDNIDHNKLIKQMWTLGIRDKRLLSIISKMLKAEIVGEGIPEKGTPQGGILSPLLSNIVLNELDWWISSQYETIKFSGNCKPESVQSKKSKTNLKKIHIVRYADDFKIFCATHEDAVRAYKATELWLKDRLGLEISPDKSKVVNLKRQYSDFLGFKLKVRKKGKKYVVRSHMSDKAYKKAHEKVSEEVKKLAHSSDDNAQFMQLQKYNSVVAGLHEYYCISTEVSHDFSRLAFSINKQLRNRLKGDLSKKGQLRNGFIKEKYGASRQMRFLHGRPVVPLGYVQSKNAQHKRKSINKYTVKGREQIHKNLAIDTATMLWLMRNPVKGRTIEYADNRISLYAAQYGKCAVTGIPMNSHDIHCHHKVPVSNGGSDEYENLILVSKAVHILIHASSEPTIEKYLKSLNLDNKQIEKLNKLRTMAEMPPIIL